MRPGLKYFLRAVSALVLVGASTIAYAQADDCKNRGQLKHVVLR
jgi:hypothetical protein